MRVHNLFAAFIKLLYAITFFHNFIATSEFPETYYIFIMYHIERFSSTDKSKVGGWGEGTRKAEG